MLVETALRCLCLWDFLWENWVYLALFWHHWTSASLGNISTPGNQKLLIIVHLEGEVDFKNFKPCLGFTRGISLGSFPNTVRFCESTQEMLTIISTPLSIRQIYLLSSAVWICCRVHRGNNTSLRSLLLKMIKNSAKALFLLSRFLLTFFQVCFTYTMLHI